MMRQQDCATETSGGYTQKKIGEDLSRGYGDSLADRQTDKQTDRLTTILRCESPVFDEVDDQHEA